jgi:hypothetical protein
MVPAPASARSNASTRARNSAAFAVQILRLLFPSQLCRGQKERLRLCRINWHGDSSIVGYSPCAIRRQSVSRFKYFFAIPGSGPSSNPNAANLMKMPRPRPSGHGISTNLQAMSAPLGLRPSTRPRLWRPGPATVAAWGQFKSALGVPLPPTRPSLMLGSTLLSPALRNSRGQGLGNTGQFVTGPTVTTYPPHRPSKVQSIGRWRWNRAS